VFVGGGEGGDRGGEVSHSVGDVWGIWPTVLAETIMGVSFIWLHVASIAMCITSILFIPEGIPCIRIPFTSETH